MRSLALVTRTSITPSCAYRPTRSGLAGARGAAAVAAAMAPARTVVTASVAVTPFMQDSSWDR